MIKNGLYKHKSIPSTIILTYPRYRSIDSNTWYDITNAKVIRLQEYWIYQGFKAYANLL